MLKPAPERVQSIQTRKKKLPDQQKLWIRDSWTTYQVWRVPIDDLVLNVDNRRFAAERLWAQDQLDRHLDPENFPDDELCIESLLLDKSHRMENGQITGKPSKDSHALENDWNRRGQETPFWIRPDGTVRNGNRRLAMIKRTQRLHGDSGLTWVDAVILDPEEIDEAALLEMEQREQLTENFKVRYNDIDYLLALREAAELRQVEWFDADSIDQVAGKLQTTVEKSKSEVIRDLYAVKYMDIFLEMASQAGEYHRLLRTLEIFRDIGRMMIGVESDYPDDFDRVLQVLFAGVRAGKKYEDIRKLREMFRKDRQRFDQLAADIGEEESKLPALQAPLETPAETAPDDTDDQEEERAGAGGPSVTDYPPTIGRMIDVAIDGHGTAQQQDVLKVLGEVLNRLESLSSGDRLKNVLQSPEEQEEAQQALRKVVTWANMHEDLLSSDD